jgi:hypothetical protein
MDVFFWEQCRRCGERFPPERMRQATDGPVCAVCNANALYGLPERMFADAIEAGWSSLLTTQNEFINRRNDPCDPASLTD